MQRSRAASQSRDRTKYRRSLRPRLCSAPLRKSYALRCVRGTRAERNACKPAENQQYTLCGPLLGGFVFFGNRLGVRTFPPVRMQMARLRPEQDLFESERSFRLLIEGVADHALYMLDPEGVVTSWNIGGQRIKGY